jgi:hypothetical protein
MFPPSLYLSLVFTWKHPESGWSISHYFSLQDEHNYGKLLSCKPKLGLLDISFH